MQTSSCSVHGQSFGGSPRRMKWIAGWSASNALCTKPAVTAAGAPAAVASSVS